MLSNILQAAARFQHNSVTLELKQIISDFNAQSDGSCRMMMYWSRGALAFSINKEGKSQQVGYHSYCLPHPTIEFRASAVLLEVCYCGGIPEDRQGDAIMLLKRQALRRKIQKLVGFFQRGFPIDLGFLFEKTTISIMPT